MGILKLFGGIAGSIAHGVQARKQREYDKAESELAYKRKKADWHEQNLYNSPEQQMKRFKEAGLNPNLIYGTGTQASSGSAAAAQVPDYTPAKGTFVDPSKGIAAFTSAAQLGIMQAQKKDLEASANLKDKQSLKTNEEAIKLDMANWLQGQLQVDPRYTAGMTKDTFDQIMSGQKINPALQERLITVAAKNANKKISEHGIEIAKYKAKLAQFGANTSDDLVVRMAAMYTIEQGEDLNTARGIAMAAQAIVTLSSMFAGSRLRRTTGGMPVNSKETQTTRWKTGHVTRTTYK